METLSSTPLVKRCFRIPKTKGEAWRFNLVYARNSLIWNWLAACGVATTVGGTILMVAIYDIICNDKPIPAYAVVTLLAVLTVGALALWKQRCVEHAICKTLADSEWEEREPSKDGKVPIFIHGAEGIAPVLKLYADELEDMRMTFGKF